MNSNKKINTIAYTCIACSLIAGFLNIPLFVSVGTLNAAEQTQIFNEQNIACLWQNFFTDIHAPGNGMIFLDDCIDKTCAYFKDVPQYERLCTTLREIKAEPSCQEVTKKLYQLTQSYAFPTSLQSIFSNIDIQACEYRIKERRAIALLDSFLNSSLTDKSLQWTMFVGKITELLDGMTDYRDLCTDLKKLSNSTSAIKIGVCLMSYFDILPKEIREKTDKIGKFGLIKLFNTRLKKIA